MSEQQQSKAVAAAAATSADAAAAASTTKSAVQVAIDKANEHKASGNKYVAEQNWPKASFEYKHCNLYLKQYIDGGDGGGGIADMVSRGRSGPPATKRELEDIHAVMFAAQCNLSLVQLKLGKPGNALAAANAALALNVAGSKAKARYRRASARLQMGLVEEAEEDFRAVLAEHPDDAGAKAGLEAVRVALQQAKRKEAAMCAKMFA